MKNKIIDRTIVVFRYIMILLLILKTQSVFTFLKEQDLHINFILILNIIILTILRIINKEIVIPKDKKSWIVLFIYYIYIVIYAIVTKCTKKSYIANYMIILPMFFVNLAWCENLKKEICAITYSFTKTMVGIALISIIFYLFGSLLNIIKPSGQIVIEWGTERVIDSYCFLHFNTQKISLLGQEIYRNSSIFTEAPMYALNLSAALIFEVFINEKNKKNISILCLGLITTITLSAFVNMFLIYLFWMIMNFKEIYIDRKKIVINSLVLVGTLIGVIILMNMRSNTSSLAIRLDDYNAAINAFKNNIFFGNGYDNEEEIKKYMSDFREYNDGVSNSISVILAQGGIYFSAIYVVPVLLLIICAIYKKNIKLCSLVILFIVSIIISIYHTTPLMLMILSMMYSYLYNYYIIEDKVKENDNNN